MTHAIVLYFSVYGSTKLVAEEIAKQTGADLAEIAPQTPYDSNRDHYDALAALAKHEHDTDARPALKPLPDLNSYDTVFIGYPMWWYTFPMAFYTFFDQADLSGKTVIPFNTHMGSRDGKTYRTIAQLARNSQVKDGLPLSMQDAERGSAKTIQKWLSHVMA
ncbi:MAG: flavodoxin [Atopobiaceae bacterium]|jgi:flavodoxin